VDLSRLDAASLRKYRRVYKLGELAAGVAKEDLVPAVLRHWQSQVLPPFLLATQLRTNGLHGRNNALSAAAVGECQVVEEEYETLLAFAMTLRKHSVAGGLGGCGGLKAKPRTAPKPKGK